MKKTSLTLSILTLLSLVACKPSGGGDNGVKSLDDGKTRIALLINGDLGDMSFWDSANEGMLKFKKDHSDCDIDIIEMGSSDSTVYESTLAKTANDSYDLIICGTTDMREPLQRLTKKDKYSDRRFIIFDTEIKDNSASSYPTVHSIMFNQNEGGYIAGTIASLLSTQTSGTNTAFIGGAANDIINDFAYGFMQGVVATNNDKQTTIGAYNSFIGDFVDSPRGKSLAQAYYSNDVNVLFAAASQAGIGCIEAAKSEGKYIIGVDSDQYAYYKDTDSSKANVIVTSIEKKVGDTLYEACEKFLNNTLTYGDLETLGVKDGKIGYVNNSNYQSIMSKENQDYVEAVVNKIKNGDITVESGLKRYTSTDKLNSLFDQLDPSK